MGGALGELSGYVAPRPLDVAPEAEGWVLDPARADFKRRLPRPFDDGLKPMTGRQSIEANATPVATNGEALADRPSAMTVAQPTHAQRLLLSWAREPGVVLVGIEQAPAWDVVGGMLPVPEAHLESLLPVFAALGVPLKDLREVSDAAPVRRPAPASAGAIRASAADQFAQWAPPGDAEPQRRRPRPARRRGLATPGPSDDGAHPPTDPGEPMEGTP